MSKLRSVSTGFWSDPFIENLTPNQKLLFLYLITNEKTNMLGIYESSTKKISFETGIKEETVVNDLKHFERLAKVKYVNNYVILINFMKHQNFNTNMMKSAIDNYEKLPNILKDNNLIIDRKNPSKGFESLLNHFGMVRKYEEEVEYEYEEENKDENQKKSCFTFEEFWELYDKKTGKSNAESKYKSIPEKERQKIKETLPLYLQRVTDKKYQKDPCTYLKGSFWNDEILTLSEKPKTTHSELAILKAKQFYDTYKDDAEFCASHSLDLLSYGITDLRIENMPITTFYFEIIQGII